MRGRVYAGACVYVGAVFVSAYSTRDWLDVEVGPRVSLPQPVSPSLSLSLSSSGQEGVCVGLRVSSCCVGSVLPRLRSFAEHVFGLLRRRRLHGREYFEGDEDAKRLDRLRLEGMDTPPAFLRIEEEHTQRERGRAEGGASLIKIAFLPFSFSVSNASLRLSLSCADEPRLFHFFFWRSTKCSRAATQLALPHPEGLLSFFLSLDR